MFQPSYDTLQKWKVTAKSSSIVTNIIHKNTSMIHNSITYKIYKKSIKINLFIIRTNIFAFKDVH